MKTIAALIVAAALFSGVRAFDGGAAVEDRANANEVAASSGSYRLVANGDEAACAVTRGARMQDGLSSLTVASNCRAVLPGIERAKFWQERDDGSVAFSADGIDPIVTFAIADGAGYESYAPALPVLSLAAEN